MRKPRWRQRFEFLARIHGEERAIQLMFPRITVSSEGVVVDGALRLAALQRLQADEKRKQTGA